MGNYSFLRALRNNPDQCFLDWDCLSQEDLEILKREWHFQSAYEHRFPSLEEMADRWNETKFCGYLTQEYIDALKVFCKTLKPYGNHPRLFYEYEGMCQIWCFEFLPESHDVKIGIYDYLPVLNQLPDAPKEYTSEIHEKWRKMYDSVEEYCQESCIDFHDWEFMEL